MTTQTDIIKMLKQGDSYKRIQKTLLVSPNTIAKANIVLKTQVKRDEETARALKKMERKRRAEQRALSTTLSTLSTNGTEKPLVNRTMRPKNSENSKKNSALFIHVNQFKTWLLGLDRSKYHDSSASAIKRLVDHKRMAFLEGYVALMNEYLEGV